MTDLDLVSRWTKTATTWLGKAVRNLVYVHNTTSNIHLRAVCTYDAANLIYMTLAELDQLVDVVDAGRLEELETAAADLKSRLRNRRLALILRNTDGRTPEEAEAFTRKAAELGG